MSNAKILIVEDERISAEYLKDIIQKAGYEVVGICDKGSEAIKLALKLKPDLIFMDIMLKDNISGSEAALKISSMIDTKIVFLTAYSDDEMIEYAIDSKAVNYLIKPYREEQIVAAIKVALNKTTIENDKSIIELKGNFRYDTRESKLFFLNSVVPLKESKLNIIKCLCKNIDRAVPYNQILNCINKSDAKLSALRTLISRINKELKFNLIENVSGVGYKISSAEKTD